MFCDKCGREIRHDSEYCSYCGTTVKSAEAGASENTNGGSPKDTHDAPCLVPRAPKKHCTDCNKELPSSSISDVCALCTIRRRNRELEKDRANSDAAYAKLDRYDISDEFDQSVFAGNKYYKSNPDSEPLYRQPSTTQHVSPFKRNYKEDDRKGGRRNLGFSWVAVIVVIALIGIFGSISEFDEPKGEAPSSAAASDISSTIENELSDLSTSAGAELPGVPASSGGLVFYDWEDLPRASLDESGSLPVMSEEGFVPQSYDDITMRVSEITLLELRKMLTEQGATPSELSVGNGKFSYDGAYLRSKGLLFYIDGNDSENSTMAFELCMMMSRTQYLILSASLDRVEQFDLRYAIASDGTLTALGALAVSTESNPASLGDDYFNDPVIFPEDF